MKILFAHYSSFNHKAIESVVNKPVDLPLEGQFKNVDVLYICVERNDTLATFISLNIPLGSYPIIVYPYAHLTAGPNLAALPYAAKIIFAIEQHLKNSYIVHRASIGWRKDLQSLAKGSNDIHFYDSKYVEIVQPVTKITHAKKIELKTHNMVAESDNVEQLFKDVTSYDVLEDRSIYYFYPTGAHVGQPLITPVGMCLFYKLEAYAKALFDQAGYLPMHSPHVWSTCTKTVQKYYNLFPNRQFTCAEDGVFRIASCLGAYSLYLANYYTIEQLPVGYYEIGPMYRFEQKGEVRKLHRLRTFTMTDLHVFVHARALFTQFSKCLDLVLKMTQYCIGTNYHCIIRYTNEFTEYNTYFTLLQEKLDVTHLYIEHIKEHPFYWTFKLEIGQLEGDRFIQLGTLQIDNKNAEAMGLKAYAKEGGKVDPRGLYILHVSPAGSIQRMMHTIELVHKVVPPHLTAVQLVVIYDEDIEREEAFINLCNELNNHKVKIKYIKTPLKALARSLSKLQSIDYGYFTVVGKTNLSTQSVILKDRNSNITSLQLNEVVSFLTR